MMRLGKEPPIPLLGSGEDGCLRFGKDGRRLDADSVPWPPCPGEEELMADSGAATSSPQPDGERRTPSARSRPLEHP
jgi:hypothetical protein